MTIDVLTATVNEIYNLISGGQNDLVLKHSQHQLRDDWPGDSIAQFLANMAEQVHNPHISALEQRNDLAKAIRDSAIDLLRVAQELDTPLLTRKDEGTCPATNS